MKIFLIALLLFISASAALGQTQNIESNDSKKIIKSLGNEVIGDKEFGTEVTVLHHKDNRNKFLVIFYEFYDQYLINEIWSTEGLNAKNHALRAAYKLAHRLPNRLSDLDITLDVIFRITGNSHLIVKMKLLEIVKIMGNKKEPAEGIEANALKSYLKKDSVTLTERQWLRTYIRPAQSGVWI